MIWCCLFHIYICGIKFFWLRYLSCFQHSKKCGYGFAKIIHHIFVGAHQAKLFSNKYFLYIQFYKLLWLWFYVDFFLNFGFYYNAVEYRHKYLNRQHINIRKISLLYRKYDASPAESPSVTSELRVSVQPASRLHLSGSCAKSYQKIISFLYIRFLPLCALLFLQ